MKIYFDIINNAKKTMNKKQKLIEIDVEFDGYDFRIFDTKHSDNSITITKDEGLFLLKKLSNLIENK